MLYVLNINKIWEGGENLKGYTVRFIKPYPNPVYKYTGLR